MAGSESVPNRSDSVVFILGAGASAAYRMPTMPAFMSYARRRAYDTYRDRADTEIERFRLERLLQFHSKSLSSTWAFNRNWDNIEELYTQADLCRIAEIPNKAEARALCEDIAWAIWDVYRCDRSDGNPFARVLDRVAEAKLRPVVITTNYDLVAERSIGVSGCNSLGGFHYPGFSNPSNPGRHFRWIGDDESSAAKEAKLAVERLLVPVVKIHGSVNWFQFGDKGVQAFYEFGLHSGGQGKRSFSEDVLPFDRFLAETIGMSGLGDVAPDRFSPVIVPPMLGKSSDLDVVTHQWKVAINELSTAREVWVVGYSFPETDAFMSRLLTEGMQSNRDLDFVALVNTTAFESFQPRMKQIFNSTFIDTRVEYYQAKSVSLFNLLKDRTWGHGKQYIDHNPHVRSDLMV